MCGAGKMRSIRRLAWATTALLLLFGSSVEAQNSASMSDEQFIASLEAMDPGESADTGRLAKLLFGVASTLEGGQTSVRLLQNAVAVRDRQAESIRAMLGVRLQEYSAALGQFRVSVSQLLDDPESRQLLFRSLMYGQEACWRLAGFTRLVETYGASGADLMSTLSSIESCKRFRQTAFQPPVHRLVAEALDEQDQLRKENRELREELEELEALIRDLIRIDQGE
jgi:hypothetical protein